MSASDQLEAISQDVHELVNVQYSTFLRSLVPALRGVGLNFIKEHEDLAAGSGRICGSLF